MAKHTRWVQYDVPLLVRVEVDDEFLDEEVTHPHDDDEDDLDDDAVTTADE